MAIPAAFCPGGSRPRPLKIATSSGWSRSGIFGCTCPSSFILRCTAHLAWPCKRPAPADSGVIRAGDPFCKPLKPCDLAPNDPARIRGLHDARVEERGSQKTFLVDFYQSSGWKVRLDHPATRSAPDPEAILAAWVTMRQQQQQIGLAELARPNSHSQLRG